MKTILLLTLALASPFSHVAALALDNQSGGLIIITDRPCPDTANGSALREAYATHADGRRIEGCWTMFDGLVQIGWGHGQRSSFDPRHFKLRDELTEPQKSKRNK